MSETYPDWSEETLVRAARSYAFEQAQYHRIQKHMWLQEAARLEERLRELVGPVRDTRTPEQRLEEGW